MDVNNRVLTIVAMVLVVAGGAYLWSTIEEPKNEVEAKQSDSVASAERPSFGAQQDTVPPPVGESLSPGTAMVRVNILSVEYEGEQPSRMVGAVQKVLGYGSSTAPLAVNKELDLQIASLVKANPEYASIFKRDTTIQLLLSQSGMQMSESSNTDQWGISTVIQHKQ